MTAMAELDTRIDEFKSAATAATAATAADKVTVAIDADLVAWMQAATVDWQGEINGLLRFYMDTAQARELNCGPDAFEPGELAQDPPHLELEFG